MTQMWQFQVDRSDLSQTRISTESVMSTEPDGSVRVELGDDEVLFHVDSFAMTANNITYAVFGDAMNYWQFFSPARDTNKTGRQGNSEWGVVPVWGFADVEESNHPGIAIGARYYGYWPSGSHLRVQPTRLSETGFVDGSPHRSDLPAVYNSYNLIDRDPIYQPDNEGLQSLLRPLFTTSFFIDDYLADNQFHDAEQVIVSSASSKTAFALAFCLHRRGTPVIGLTSAGNVEFVKGLGWYDEVLTYDEVKSSDCLQVPSAYVDMSGDSVVRSNIHHNSADLRFDLMVGATHWSSPPGDSDLPGPTPEFFFAPTQIAKRAQDWGPGGIATRTAESWEPFVEEVASLLTVESRSGADACQAAYLAALDGSADPATGVTITT